MQLVGGGAQNFQQWFDFLGLIKDKQPTRIGAPYQMDFPGEHALPAGMAVMKETIPTCWDPAFKCSCGDCPDAPQCIPVSCLLSCWPSAPVCPAPKVADCITHRPVLHSLAPSVMFHPWHRKSSVFSEGYVSLHGQLQPTPNSALCRHLSLAHSEQR